MIFNIQKCSIHDGSGLRTIIFFKGCYLKCKWCANPESQSYESEIMESPVRCVGCGACKSVCPQLAISDDFIIDRSRCNHCMKCIEVCYAESKKIAGKDYTIDELYEEIEKDKPFYSMFGGGVTFSGGEPLTHSEYLKDIAAQCRKKGIHVMVESCGYGNFEKFKSALSYIDAMFMDVKHIDSGKHKKITGVGNELVLENIKRISEQGMPITIRTPIVPGCTDSEENIRGIAHFVAGLPSVKEYELLPYHDFGKSKYTALGRSYLLSKTEVPTDEQMRAFVKAANGVLAECGKECYWIKDNNREVAK